MTKSTGRASFFWGGGEEEALGRTKKNRGKSLIFNIQNLIRTLIFLFFDNFLVFSGSTMVLIVYFEKTSCANIYLLGGERCCRLRSSLIAGNLLLIFGAS